MPSAYRAQLGREYLLKRWSATPFRSAYAIPLGRNNTLLPRRERGRCQGAMKIMDSGSQKLRSLARQTPGRWAILSCVENRPARSKPWLGCMSRATISTSGNRLRLPCILGSKSRQDTLSYTPSSKLAPYLDANDRAQKARPDRSGRAFAIERGCALYLVWFSF